MNKLVILLLSILIISACGSKKEIAAVETPATVEPAMTKEGPARGESDRPERPKQIDPEQMAALLNLSEEQEERYLQHIEEHKVALKAARAEANGDREVLKEKLMGIRDSREAGIKEILTPEQLLQYREIMKKNRRPRNKGKNRGGRGGN